MPSLNGVLLMSSPRTLPAPTPFSVLSLLGLTQADCNTSLLVLAPSFQILEFLPPSRPSGLYLNLSPLIAPSKIPH